jgi:hypothetical protein
MGQKRFSRRSVLGSVGAASVVPTITGGSAVASATALPFDNGVQVAPAFVATLNVGRQIRNDASPRHFSAPILGGEVTGVLLSGLIQPGRIEWTIDAASNTVELIASYAVLRADGALIQVKDRCVHAVAAAPAASAGIRTAPELLADSAHVELPPSVLVGMLDASGFADGRVSLRAFRIA